MAYDDDWLADDEGNLTPEVARFVSSTPATRRVGGTVPAAPRKGDMLEQLGSGFWRALLTLADGYAQARATRQVQAEAPARRLSRPSRGARRPWRALLGLLILLVLGLFACAIAHRKSAPLVGAQFDYDAYTRSRQSAPR
jgi:hypothetical protein